MRGTGTQARPRPDAVLASLLRAEDKVKPLPSQPSCPSASAHNVRWPRPAMTELQATAQLPGALVSTGNVQRLQLHSPGRSLTHRPLTKGVRPPSHVSAPCSVTDANGGLSLRGPLPRSR